MRPAICSTRFVDIQGLLQRVQGKKARMDHARAAVGALEPDEHDELLAEMVERAAARSTPVIAVTIGEPTVVASGKTKTDLAEDLVRSQPGITTKQIASMIGQSAKVAGTTLHSIKEKRGSVENRNGGWYPVTKRSSPEGTVRELILKAMQGANRPLRTGEIYDAIKLIDPAVNKNSVSAQVHRMLNVEPPLLEKRGEDRLGPLYVLASAPKTTNGVQQVH